LPCLALGNPWGVSSDLLVFVYSNEAKWLSFLSAISIQTSSLNIFTYGRDFGNLVMFCFHAVCDEHEVLTLCDDSHKVMTTLIVILSSKHWCGDFSAMSWMYSASCRARKLPFKVQGYEITFDKLWGLLHVLVVVPEKMKGVTSWGVCR
jgi:hypothetical protein